MTGPKLRAIVGDAAAARIRAGIAAAKRDGDGYRHVDLGADRLAVLAALRELSPDAADSTELQASEALLKALAAND